MYQEILSIAKSKLAGSYDNVIEELNVIISMGSTGGEIIAMVGKYLKDLEQKNLQVYEIMKKDILDYLNECRKQGLYIV